jgi:hypothetical protein
VSRDCIGLLPQISLALKSAIANTLALYFPVHRDESDSRPDEHSQPPDPHLPPRQWASPANGTSVESGPEIRKLVFAYIAPLITASQACVSFFVPRLGFALNPLAPPPPPLLDLLHPSGPSTQAALVAPSHGTHRRGYSRYGPPLEFLFRVLDRLPPPRARRVGDLLFAPLRALRTYGIESAERMAAL